jgi:hypothetical protein
MYLFATNMEALLLGMREPSDFLFTSFVIVISLIAHFIEQFNTSQKKKFMEGVLLFWEGITML